MHSRRHKKRGTFAFDMFRSRFDWIGNNFCVRFRTPAGPRVLSCRCTRTCTPGRARKALTLARMLLLLLQIDGREIVNYVRHFDYFALITLLRGRWSGGSSCGDKSKGWRRLGGRVFLLRGAFCLGFFVTHRSVKPF